MNETTITQKKFSTQTLVIMAMFAAVICVSAYISIPLPNGSHITFLNFITTLVSLLFPGEQAVLIILVWLLLGAVGVPVFIGGNAGIGYLFGPLGGYSFAFLLVAILVPLLRGKKYSRLRYTITALLSVVLVDFVGTVWMMILAHMTWKAAFIAGFLPFIPLDIVKAVISAQLIPAFRHVIHTPE